VTSRTDVSVSGKVAVVVEGTSGIGEAIALGFAEDGADVAATSRTAEDVAATAGKLRDRTLEALGGIDVLVNSAGTAARSAFPDLDEEEWNRVLDVQLTGVFRTCQEFARAMDAGSLVNVSSMSADLARTRLLPYCAAKSGVNALTRCAARELAPDVRVNAVAPGFVITPGAANPGPRRGPARGSAPRSPGSSPCRTRPRGRRADGRGRWIRRRRCRPR